MNYVADHWSDILQRAWQHTLLSGIPLLIGLALALPLGWLAHSRPRWRGVMVAGSGLLYTIPSLALFIVMPALLINFVGDGLRSDYKPLNQNTGIALGNPINLNFNPGKPYSPDFNQSPYTFQSYSHYVMPGGLVESFIDSIGGNHDGNPVRGGSLAPTVKLDINGDTTSVDRSYGTNGLGGFGHIPANKSYDPGYDKR